MDIFAGLNERQIAAVQHIKGPLLVVAGAGSGKTRVLTHRVAHMIAQGVAPYNILAVTFTNKAAGEMKARVENILGKQRFMPFIGTFHALGVRILRAEMEALGRESTFTIFDTADTQKLVKQIIKDQNIDPKKYSPRGVLSQISAAKNALLTPSEYSGSVDSLFQENVAQIFEEYTKRMLEANAVDFDDLLVLPVRIFQENPSILEKYQDRWQFISIDEYQDTNHVQYLLAKLLSEKYCHLCAIGDSDQSIYSFRGADIRNILEFENAYPDAEVIKLEQNYRSTKNILSAADGVIEQNMSRVKKTMFTVAEEGEKVRIWETENEQSEAERILRQIQWLTRHEDSQYSDIAILYRTNAQSRVLEEAALRNGVPYQIIGGIRFYERAEIKDLIAYLRFVMNSADTVSFERIVNTPSRRIGATTAFKVLNFARQKEMPVGDVLDHIGMADGIAKTTQKAITDFSALIKSLRAVQPTLTASDFLRRIVEKIGFEAYLRDGTMEGDTRWDNVQELFSVAQKFDHVRREDSVPLFLEEIALLSDIDQKDESADTITMMTLHAAKGLEFPAVFIAGCEENIFPHSRTLFEPDQLEEERRLMYVGMTRARKRLYLSYANQRLLYGSFTMNRPSRFLREIPLDAVDPESLPYDFRTGSADDADEVRYTAYDDEWSTPEYRAEDAVVHPQFGEGRIQQIEGDILTIDFGAGNVRRFAGSIAPLRKIDSEE